MIFTYFFTVIMIRLALTCVGFEIISTVVKKIVDIWKSKH